MKTDLELRHSLLTELNEEELRTTDGGYWWVAIAGSIVVYDAVTDFLKGFEAGFNAAQAGAKAAAQE